MRPSIAKWISARLIRQHKLLAVLVIASLTLGIAQRVGIGLILGSIQNALVHQSKTFLLADVEVRSVEAFTPEQEAALIDVLPKNAKLQHSVECLSIAVSSANYQSTLVSLKAVEGRFPFYGSLKLKAHGPPHDAKQAVESMQRHPEAWIDPALKITLGLKEGDLLYLGNVAFIVKGYIAAEPGEGIQGFSFGPRVYIGLPFLRKSGLMSEGSRVSHLILIQLPESQNPLRIAKKIRAIWHLSGKSDQWRTPFSSGDGIQVTTHIEKARQWIRLYTEVGQFFSIVSLLMLILSALAVGTMLRGYCEKNLPQLGTLHLLGASRKEVTKTLARLLAYFIGIGAVLGTVIGIIGFGLIEWKFQDFLPTAWYGWWVLKPIFFGVMESAIFAFGFGSIPMILTMTWTPIELANGASTRKIPKQILTGLGASVSILVGVFFYIDTFNLKLAIIGSLGLAGVLLACIGIAIAFTHFCTRMSQYWSFEFQYGFNNLYRFRQHLVWAITSLAIGMLCLSMVNIVKESLISELQEDRTQVFPDLFLVGIYDHQKDDLTHYFYQWTSKLQLSPVIKARLTQINAKKVVYSSGDQQRDHLLNREQNLSYRDQLSEGEKLTAGDWMKGWYQVEASLEEGFAKHIGITLGDTLTFTIQGVEVKAKVTSLRSVKWTTFKPNFFILLSPNALKDAPKEWLGSVSGLSLEAIPKVQAQLAEQFPSVTTIPVKESVEKIKRILNLVFHSIEILAYLAILSAIATLFSVVLLTLSLRQKDVHTLKILGFSYKSIRRAIVVEFSALVTLSFVIGTGLGTALSALFIETQTSLNLIIPIGSLWWLFILFLALALGMAIGVARHLYQQKPKL